MVRDRISELPLFWKSRVGWIGLVNEIRGGADLEMKVEETAFSEIGTAFAFAAFLHG